MVSEGMVMVKNSNHLPPIQCLAGGRTAGKALQELAKGLFLEVARTRDILIQHN